jgi:hypothetical protein
MYFFSDSISLIIYLTKNLTCIKKLFLKELRNIKFYKIKGFCMIFISGKQ